MPKHHKNENETADFFKNAGAFIDSIAKNKEDNAWLKNEVLNEGPHHKQLYSSLLLQRVETLLHAIEKQTGKSFSIQKGINLTSHKEGYEIPVPLVLKSIQKNQQEEFTEILSHAPAHEIIAFNSVLQAIEWSIDALNKTSN